MKKFLRGFVWAAQGIVSCVRCERNFRFHLCAGALVLWLAVQYYDFTALHWAVLSLTVAGVLALEAVNSAIERAVDVSVQEQNPLAGQAKDIAAGAVLLFCLGAVGVGVALFWQPQVLLFMLKDLLSHWYKLLLLAAYLAAAAVFILTTPKDRGN